MINGKRLRQELEMVFIKMRCVAIERLSEFMDRTMLIRPSEINPKAEPAADPGTLTISCYENEIPSFVAHEIDRLYEHLGCSFLNYSVMNTLDGASTYVVRQGGAAVTVLLFRRELHQVTVITEFVKLDEASVQLFAETMFAKFKSVWIVLFKKIQVGLEKLPYPYLRLNCTEDIVVTLPPTVKEYQDSLGKNMRRNIKRYGSTLEQDFPSYRYQVYVKEQVREQDIRSIIKLNWSRMAGKNIVSRIDEEETQWIVRLVQQCGIVGVATIEGQVSGGAIGFRIGDNYFMHVIAHDPLYNDYSLGIICYYFTICEGIIRGGKRFHLSWGRYEYKYRLLGVTIDIAQVNIYRNRTCAILCSGDIIKAAGAGYIRQGKLWLLEADRRDGRMALFASKIVRVLRIFKRSGLSGFLGKKADSGKA
jgi:hypothetical protein